MKYVEAGTMRVLWVDQACASLRMHLTELPDQRGMRRQTERGLPKN